MKLDGSSRRSGWITLAGACAIFLQGLERNIPVAVEASGGWYWFMDELEAAGMDARLVNPLEAKRRIGGRNKTDKLDARGLGLRSHTTVLKNRIHAALKRGTLDSEPASDLFAKKQRLRLSLPGLAVKPKQGGRELALPRQSRLPDRRSGRSPAWPCPPSG
jgi:transposase